MSTKDASQATLLQRPLADASQAATLLQHLVLYPPIDEDIATNITRKQEFYEDKLGAVSDEPHPGTLLPHQTFFQRMFSPETSYDRG